MLEVPHNELSAHPPAISPAVSVSGLLHSLPLHSHSCSFISLTQLHFSFILLLILQYLEYKVFPCPYGAIQQCHRLPGCPQVELGQGELSLVNKWCPSHNP